MFENIVRINSVEIPIKCLNVKQVKLCSKLALINGSVFYNNTRQALKDENSYTVEILYGRLLFYVPLLNVFRCYLTTLGPHHQYGIISYRLQSNFTDMEIVGIKTGLLETLYIINSLTQLGFDKYQTYQSLSALAGMISEKYLDLDENLFM